MEEVQFYHNIPNSAFLLFWLLIKTPLEQQNNGSNKQLLKSTFSRIKSTSFFSNINNYIGADYTSQISLTSFRFASLDRLDFDCYNPPPIRSLVALLLAGIVSLASRYNYCSTASRLFFSLRSKITYQY